jgi:acyl dehydratase
MDEPATLVKNATTRQLVQYAGASGDFYEIHYDQEFARGVGLPGVILHGLLKAAWLAQVVTDWLGDRGRIRWFEATYRGMDGPGSPYRCGGRVREVRGREVELELWGEDAEGRRTTLGAALVEMR